jgi:hypothetical protein
MHFTPTRSSWLNLVERVFGDPDGQTASSRRVSQCPRIDAYTTQRHAQPTPLVWTKPAREILAKVNRTRRVRDKTRTV